jgi:hypothetical protein
MAEAKPAVTAESVAQAKAKIVEEVDKRMVGRPTPTQSELDRLNLGEHVDLEPDGSDPDPKAPGWHKAALEADKPAGQGGSYQTRASRPASTTSHPGSTHSSS